MIPTDGDGYGYGYGYGLNPLLIRAMIPTLHRFQDVYKIES